VKYDKLLRFFGEYPAMGEALYRWSVMALCWSIDRKDEAGIDGNHRRIIWCVALELADLL